MDANFIYKKYVKRVIDIAGSACGIVVLGIPMIVISATIKHEDPGPVIFKQKRVGKDKKYFNMYKFRSMKLDTPHDVPTHLLANPDQYILNCGKTIRKYSLDELPQMFNILKGDMSIIGPRPALWNQEDLVEERDKYGANDTRPGLTGWAQINGRDELANNIPEKAKYDGEYAIRESIVFDTRCFLETICKVLKCKDVHEGMENR